MRSEWMAAVLAAALLAGCAEDEGASKPAAPDARPLVRVGAVEPAHRFREVRRVQAALRTKEERFRGVVDPADMGPSIEKWLT